MLLKDIMTKTSAVCTESMPLERVYEMMQQSADRFAIVVENQAHQKPLGIITEHDICLQILGRNRNPRGMAAANVMNTRIVKANRNLSVPDCAKLIDEGFAQRIFVVDDNGILCGTVAQTDLIPSKSLRSAGHRYPSYADFQVSRMDRIF